MRPHLASDFTSVVPEIGLVCGSRCVHMTHVVVFIVWSRTPGGEGSCFLL